MPRSPEIVSLWRPLRVSNFRNLIIADVVSDVGAFMQSTGAAWLMVVLDGGRGAPACSTDHWRVDWATGAPDSDLCPVGGRCIRDTIVARCLAGPGQEGG